MDRISTAQRSLNMSKIKSKNTLPELFVFAELKKLGYKFKKHYPIVGKPDLVFEKQKIAVFIDGEYWHGRNFKKIKHQLSVFWIAKISSNIKRDRKNRSQLRKEGWIVMRIWDKDLKKQPIYEINKIIKQVGSLPNKKIF